MLPLDSALEAATSAPSSAPYSWRATLGRDVRSSTPR